MSEAKKLIDEVIESKTQESSKLDDYVFVTVEFSGALGLIDDEDAVLFYRDLKQLMKKHTAMGFDYDLQATSQQFDDGRPISSKKNLV